MNMIEVKDVSKRFGEFTALDEVSFTVGEGERCLLLGPNGAGKTTLLRCIMGLLRFDGEILVEGLSVKRFGKRIRSGIAYLPQAGVIPNDMTCRELLEFSARLRELEVDAEELLRRAGLEGRLGSRIGDLSGGMRQRLALIAALISDPQLLIFDEPLTNLDFEGRMEFTRLVSSLDQKRTAIISIHALGELLPLAGRVLIMNGGRLIFAASTHEVLSRFNRSYRVYINVKNTNVAVGELADLPCEKRSPDLLMVRTSNLTGLFKKLDSLGVPMDGVFVEGPSADEVVEGLLKERGDRD